MSPTLIQHALLLSLALFAIGVLGVFLRRNVITVFMCVELMLNAVNLAFVAFSRALGHPRRAGARLLRADRGGGGGGGGPRHRHRPPPAQGHPRRGRLQPHEVVMVAPSEHAPAGHGTGHGHPPEAGFAGSPWLVLLAWIVLVAAGSWLLRAFPDAVPFAILLLPLAGLHGARPLRRRHPRIRGKGGAPASWPASPCMTSFGALGGGGLPDHAVPARRYRAPLLAALPRVRVDGGGAASACR